jgi:hypothetical protein
MAFEFHSTAKLGYREIDTFVSRLNFKFVKICFSSNVAWKVRPRKVDIPTFISTKTLSIHINMFWKNVNNWWFNYLGQKMEAKSSFCGTYWGWTKTLIEDSKPFVSDMGTGQSSPALFCPEAGKVTKTVFALPCKIAGQGTGWRLYNKVLKSMK